MRRRSSAAPSNWWPKQPAHEGYILYAICMFCGQEIVHGSTYTDGNWHHGTHRVDISTFEVFLRLDYKRDEDHLPIIPTGKEPKEWWLQHGVKFIKDPRHPKWKNQYPQYHQPKKKLSEITIDYDEMNKP
jgi:hypothetical protein